MSGLNKRERHIARVALRYAIDYQESFIDAHRTGWERNTSKRCIPRSHRAIVTKTRQLIAQFEKVMSKLQEPVK